MDNVNILDLITYGESEEVECKLADGGLPKDLWETYSAFANTSGGVILLGIKEKKGQFEIFGVNNPQRLQKEFWDTLNNPQKVNLNILKNENVVVSDVKGKKILKIFIPRAFREQRPIYISSNPFNGTYRRNYEGDYKCTTEEVKRMLADQSNISQDSIVLANYSLKDINIDSLKSYRERLSSRKPSHPWLGLNDIEFLDNIGAWGRDRERNHQGLTVAGLLMFGKERVITEILPHYFLDYREKFTGDERWSNRVISSSGTWSGNLYDFYFMVINKLTSNLDVPFRMQGLIRQDDTRVHAALREALVNALVHADYNGKISITIEKNENFFRFTNPGGLRMPVRTALKGGISDPRNPNLFKMFNLLGIGERAGSGLANIQLAWKEQHWRTPELVEEYQPDRTILVLRTISLLPTESLEFFRSVLGNVFFELSNDEILILVTAEQESQVTNARLQVILDEHSADINKILNGLVDKKFLVTEGQRKGTRYKLSQIFDKENISITNLSIQDNSEISNGGNSVSNQKELENISLLAREKRRLNSNEMEEIILKLCSIKPLKLKELAKLLSRNSDGIRNNYLNKLEKEGKLKLKYPGQKNYPFQAYETVK
ncbi:MAG: putative DNA binding domain-containing protein [Halanaerobiales bacterium]|nr:putative DNA binding domain-containing protein [Halanaerobiales bacterium]